MAAGLAATCDKCGGEVAGTEAPTLTPPPPNCTDVSCASLVEFEGGEAGKGRGGHLLERKNV
jgi:hypothetical protein